MATVPVTPEPETSSPPEAPRQRRKPPVGLLILALLAILAIAFGVRRVMWNRNHVDTDDAQVEGDVIPVLAKVTGFVTDIAVQENQRVAEGQPLLQLDDREYRARLAQTQADLVAARTVGGRQGGTGQAMAQLEAAREAVLQARANTQRAEADVARFRELAPRGIVSRQQLDAAEATATAAEAAEAAAEKQALAAQAALAGADAKTAAAEAQRDAAELNVAWSRILAPRAGIVSRKSVEVGQLVTAGQPLMSVVTIDDVWVVANLKETQLANVDPGDRAEIDVDAYPGRRFAAHVESVAPATGAKFSLLPPDNATGNFTKVVQRIPVRLRLDGPQDPAHLLRPGMSVQVTITTK